MLVQATFLATPPSLAYASLDPLCVFVVDGHHDGGVGSLSPGELKPATCGRNRPSHLTIPPKLRVLSQTSPYEQFAWVCLWKDSQLPSHFGWVDFAHRWLV